MRYEVYAGLFLLSVNVLACDSLPQPEIDDEHTLAELEGSTKTERQIADSMAWVRYTDQTYHRIWKVNKAATVAVMRVVGAARGAGGFVRIDPARLNEVEAKQARIAALADSIAASSPPPDARLDRDALRLWHQDVLRFARRLAWGLEEVVQALEAKDEPRLMRAWKLVGDAGGLDPKELRARYRSLLRASEVEIGILSSPPDTEAPDPEGSL